MGKILVFGATGYVGRYLVVDMFQKGYDVLALGRNKEVLSFFQSQGIPTQRFDILNEADYEQLPTQGVQAIVNLTVALPELEFEERHFFDINVWGNLNLLKFAYKNGIRRFIMPSSHKVYYDIYKPLISEEDLPCFKGPHSPYIISKLAAENYMQHYAKDYGMDCIVLRFTGVHGYGSLMGFLKKDGSYTRGGCEWIMEHAIKGERIEVWGDTTIKRDHVYIKDVVDAIETSINAPEGTKGIFNVANGVAYDLLEEANAIADVFAGENGRSEIVLCPDKPGVKRGYHYDISKIKRVMGWQPKYSDLHVMYEDYKAEWKKGIFHNYHYIKREDKPITF